MMHPARRPVVPALLVALCLGVLPLAGCGERPWMLENSTIKPVALTLKESRYVTRTPLASLTEADVQKAASTFARSGMGPFYFVIAYADTRKGADRAVSEGQKRILNALAASGVPADRLVTSTIPLDVEAPVALLTFDTLAASRADHGTDRPGLQAPVGERDALGYGLGCGVADMMAQQVATPTDLEGVAGLGGRNDGDRAAQIVATQYRTGTPRDYLPSYIISELAGSGGN